MTKEYRHPVTGETDEEHLAWLRAASNEADEICCEGYRVMINGYNFATYIPLTLTAHYNVAVVTNRTTITIFSKEEQIARERTLNRERKIAAFSRNYNLPMLKVANFDKWPNRYKVLYKLTYGSE